MSFLRNFTKRKHKNKNISEEKLDSPAPENGSSGWEPEILLPAARKKTIAPSQTDFNTVTRLAGMDSDSHLLTPRLDPKNVLLPEETRSLNEQTTTSHATNYPIMGTPQLRQKFLEQDAINSHPVSLVGHQMFDSTTAQFMAAKSADILGNYYNSYTPNSEIDHKPVHQPPSQTNAIVPLSTTTFANPNYGALCKFEGRNNKENKQHMREQLVDEMTLEFIQKIRDDFTSTVSNFSPVKIVSTRLESLCGGRLRGDQALFLLMGILALLPVFRNFPELICTTTSFAYPSYKSFQAMKSQNIEVLKEWLSYWIMLAFYQVLSFWCSPIVQLFPFYWLIECVFYLWLVSPYTRGAQNLYKVFMNKN